MKQYFQNIFSDIKEKLFKKKFIILILLSFIYLIFLLIINLINSSFYGYFVDEFYYIACTNHPALGYVDHPPFSIFVLWIWIKISGNSILSLKILTFLIIASTALMAAAITAKLGGRLFSQIVASISFMMIPIVMSFSNFYSMNVIEILICNICIYLLIKIIKENKVKLWIMIGTLAGIGLLNKHTFIIYIISIMLGMLLTKERKYFFNIWFLIGLILAFLTFMPNIIWQITNDWPSLEFYRMAIKIKSIKYSFDKILISIILGYNPILFLVWLAGLFYLFFTRQGGGYKVFGWAFIFVLFYFMITREGRIDRIAGIFPVLISSGAILMEKYLSKKYFIWIKSIVIVLIISSGIFLSPICLPVLRPVNAAECFTKFGSGNIWFAGIRGDMESTLFGRIGWEEMVKKIADIYNSLPDEERKHTGIFCPHYSLAGAVDLFGKKYGLPDSISGHNNYFLWGKKESVKYDEFIYIDTSLIKNYQKFMIDFDENQLLSTISNEYSPAFMREFKIYIAKKPKIKFEDVWKSFKFYL